MKTLYIDQKNKLSSRKIRKIAKKANKINKKEEVAVAISHELMDNRELIEEIERYKIKVLNRKMAS